MTQEQTPPVRESKKSSLREAKVYVLMEHMHPTAPIYTQVSRDQRVRHDRLKLWAPFLQVTFTDADGMNRTARLKLNCNTIWQDEQIKNHNIPANAKFTDAERNAVKFHYGKLITTNAQVQNYLEAIPHFEGFKGENTDKNVSVAYRIDDAKARIKNENTLIRRQIEAANKVLKYKLQTAQDLLRIIHGSTYIPSDNLEECQNEIVSLMNDSDEVMEKVMATENQNTPEEDALIMISKLIQAGKLSFDKEADKVVRLKNDKWETVREISSIDFSIDQRVDMFISYLLDQGKALHDDLKIEYSKLKQ